MRLDIYLVNHHLAQSRGRAKDMLNAGKVLVNGVVTTKGSYEVKDDDQVSLLEGDHHYVSRSALKLKGLLDKHNLRFDKQVVIDIGASTGGFTQVALEYGAEHVYAVDVGKEQLHEQIRDDGRVTVCEQQDARTIMSHMFDFPPITLIADVSFISLTKIIPAVIEELTEVQNLYLLVKPQFELEKSAIGKGGLVKNEEGRQRALQNVKNCVENLGFRVEYEMESALSGSDGNREYMLHAKKVVEDD